MKKSYDMKRVIKAIVDKGDFFEIAADYAKNMIIGFARMGGKVVGIVANQPMFLQDALTSMPLTRVPGSFAPATPIISP